MPNLQMPPMGLGTFSHVYSYPDQFPQDGYSVIKVIYYLCRTLGVCYTFQKPDSVKQGTQCLGPAHRIPSSGLYPNKTEDKQTFLLAKTDERIH